MTTAARAYATHNVGFVVDPDPSATAYGPLNVGFVVDPGRAGHGYATLNATTGVGVALYPWREDPARPPRVRR